MKKIKIIVFFVIVLIITFVVLNLRSQKDYNIFSSYPKCPANLSGILTVPLIELKKIAAITPLGNINPPGHTSPVDHNYFDANTSEKVAIYAPADGWITNIVAILAEDKATSKYKEKWITIDIEICKGLVLTFANLTESSDILKNNWPKKDNGCKYGINKEGHDFTEGQCYFHSNIKVKAGDLLGYSQKETTVEGRNDFPFEIWAANYNKKPRADINWDKYYKDDRMAHIMCTFDLYSDQLKKPFYAKFGAWREGKFMPRTIEPLCGQVAQDIVGTIQGMWFSKPTPDDDYDAKFNGGLAFLHDNIDPKTGEISIGGDLNKNKPEVIYFDPTHSGQINREPSEIKADGKVYCYDNHRGESYKFIVQLIDDHHLNAEIQDGKCNGSETFVKPYNYER